MDGVHNKYGIFNQSVQGNSSDCQSRVDSIIGNLACSIFRAIGSGLCKSSTPLTLVILSGLVVFSAPFKTVILTGLVFLAFDTLFKTLFTAFNSCVAGEEHQEEQPPHWLSQWRKGREESINRKVEGEITKYERRGFQQADYTQLTEEQAVAKLIERANQKIPNDQYNLGLLYERGSMTLEKDGEKAKKLFEEAADQGHPLAKKKLKELGQAPAEEQTPAFARLRARAKEGDPDAQYNLGRIYEEGLRGVEKNDEEAKKWFTKAADQGHFLAQWALNIH